MTIVRGDISDTQWGEVQYTLIVSYTFKGEHRNIEIPSAVYRAITKDGITHVKYEVMDKPKDTPDCCQGVDGPCYNKPVWRRQDTAYTVEILNWVNMCDGCFDYIQLQWASAWRDLYGVTRLLT
jgi:hypothetical protein